MLSTLIAQATDAPQEGDLIITLLVTWGPVFLIALILFFLFRTIKTSENIRKRSAAHMDHMEAKTDEMIALLKEIRDQGSQQ
jgi:large-conductance mechanosensitive channel